ncbi:unnamed protein product [Sphagnum balticum]
MYTLAESNALLYGKAKQAMATTDLNPFAKELNCTECSWIYVKPTYAPRCGWPLFGSTLGGPGGGSPQQRASFRKTGRSKRGLLAELENPRDEPEVSQP